MGPSSIATQSVIVVETFNAYLNRIYQLDFCSYNHVNIFRFSLFGKLEVDVYRFMSSCKSMHFRLSQIRFIDCRIQDER